MKKRSEKGTPPIRFLGWDDLIAITQENIARLELRLVQLRALEKYFKGRKATGEPCPVEV